MRIILFNAFHGGSHRSWAENMVSCSSHEIYCISLPGRHWKWRMHAAAIELADRYNKLSIPSPDLILYTDMLDAPLLKSLLPAKLSSIPFCCYFHENQISYPWSDDDQDPALKRDLHYGFKNYTNALVSDFIIFNSSFHKNNFLDELPGFLGKYPDYKGIDNIRKLRDKATVLAPGIPALEISMNQRKNEIPVILWNHRWEYDKAPDKFLELLNKIKASGIEFQLIVLGESYKKEPAAFDKMKDKFSANIIHWGYAESRIEYLQLLRKSDLLPVTAIQEFFGISVIEAILSGVFPLLPDRLAYPEHIPHHLKEHHIYLDEAELSDMSTRFLKRPEVPDILLVEKLKEYLWENLIHKYDDYFSRIVHSWNEGSN